ncbi:MAG: aspartate/glutamate racemase family protein [Deltaproteobacteria bacterium]|nr:aspartate/glutamate racemase family protein [Deltaproteobacteria bacterium]MBW1930462.1 aspartate/glutamate racemase family protein [Deltaproteobacteria bacterium]MBW2026911.1 aspartate/glutamate racemase family protein [Deltaproteobacteria bacterium]
MKTMGLIGGMSWESTLEYYRIINEEVRNRLGGQHSAELLLYSLDFHPIEELQRQGKWDEMTQILIDAAKRLEKAGADFVLICTNTMHKMAPEVQDSIKVPLLHIADATAEQIKASGFSKVGLLGTKYTMEQDFLKGHLSSKHGLEVVISDDASRDIVHNVIYDELCLGTIKEESKKKFLKIIQDLAANGAQGIILGCTEIPLLVHAEDTSLPLFNTTAIHAKKAVDMALEGSEPQKA